MFFSDIIFCTDEYLFNFYSKIGFFKKNINIFRNFVNLCFVDKKHKPKKTKKLKLVYIGSMNEKRGLIECANYCKKFNNENKENILEFHVYGKDNKLIERLAKDKLVNYNGFVDHKEIFEILPRYDIGICLWQRIKKYERNLPIKNFEYMAVGLPVLTSNFGNLRTYIDKSKAGICINPDSYEEFKLAINKLKDINFRKEMSSNGVEFTKNYLCLDDEIEPYIDFIYKA
jgi:glycosyltransferase involved in cell wall biosynthesis